tara:strand:- start:1573 stop:1764 length:192 start_codon:yes stop_codon:yes gene_type:complete
MAKSMKVPVLIFEHIQEPSILLEALQKILKKTKPISLKEDRILILIKELKKTIEIMKKSNINR